MNNGIIYIVTGKEDLYINEFKQSYNSLRKHYSGEVSLITDGEILFNNRDILTLDDDLIYDMIPEYSLNSFEAPIKDHGYQCLEDVTYEKPSHSKWSSHQILISSYESLLSKKSSAKLNGSLVCREQSPTQVPYLCT